MDIVSEEEKMNIVVDKFSQIKFSEYGCRQFFQIKVSGFDGIPMQTTGKPRDQKTNDMCMEKKKKNKGGAFFYLIQLYLSKKKIGELS